VGQQQPAGAALRNGVHAVADHPLHHLIDVRLRVAMEQVVQRTARSDLAPEDRRRHAHASDRNLDKGLAQHAPSTQEDREAHHPFVADHGDFNQRALLCDPKHRDDPALDEPDVRDGRVSGVETLPQREGDRLQVGQETQVLGPRQSRQQPVGAGAVRSRSAGRKSLGHPHSSPACSRHR
jgi:hypothetical protein